MPESAHAPLPAWDTLTFGLVTGQHHFSWSALVDIWQRADLAGFDSLWLFDHFLALYGDSAGDTLEASTLLAGLAALTKRARIGVLVYGNTHRNPLVLAKEMTTVDHISGGRAILGIGAGWNEPEHRAFSIPFPSPGDRVTMLDEALTAMASFFIEDRTSYEGKFYHFVDAPFSPKPVQRRLPVLIGGHRPRMLELIGRHADFWDGSGSPSDIEAAGTIIDDHSVAAGRAAGSVVRGISLGADHLESATAFEKIVREYHAAGVRQFLFDIPLTDAGVDLTLAMASDLMPALRQELNAASSV